MFDKPAPSDIQLRVFRIFCSICHLGEVSTANLHFTGYLHFETFKGSLATPTELLVTTGFLALSGVVVHCFCRSVVSLCHFLLCCVMLCWLFAGCVVLVVLLWYVCVCVLIVYFCFCCSVCSFCFEESGATSVGVFCCL